MLFMRKTTALPSAAEALPGRTKPIPTATSHFVSGNMQAARSRARRGGRRLLGHVPHGRRCTHKSLARNATLSRSL